MYTCMPLKQKTYIEKKKCLKKNNSSVDIQSNKNVIMELTLDYITFF